MSQFQDILLHMTNNHDINLRNTIRRMEALAGRSVEPQKCRICEAVFKGVSEIQVNAAFNTRNHTDKHKCQVHFKDNHPDQHPFECDLCGHRAIDGSRLKRHLMCHEPDRPREYCNICFKEFRNKVSLRTHKNMVHKVNNYIRIFPPPFPWLSASLYVSLGSSTPARIVARSFTRPSM